MLQINCILISWNFYYSSCFFSSFPFLVSFIHLADHLMLTRSMLRLLISLSPHTRSSSINVKLWRTVHSSFTDSICTLFCVKLIDPFFLNHALIIFFIGIVRLLSNNAKEFEPSKREREKYIYKILKNNKSDSISCVGTRLNF